MLPDCVPLLDGVRVAAIDRVIVEKDVADLDILILFVAVAVDRTEPVSRGEGVVVLDIAVVAVLVPLELCERLDRIVHEEVPDALDVLEEETLPLMVAVF